MIDDYIYIKDTKRVFSVEVTMNKLEAKAVFDQFGAKGRYVFHLRDLEKIFPDETPRALKASIKRLVDSKNSNSRC